MFTTFEDRNTQTGIREKSAVHREGVARAGAAVALVNAMVHIMLLITSDQLV